MNNAAQNNLSNASLGGIINSTNAAKNVYGPQPSQQNISKILTAHITQDMLDSEPFKVSLQVAEDLWRAAHGDSWIEVGKLNDFHYGIACRLLMRNKLEKFVVAYNEVVRVVD
jgi:hypothetical protein